MGLFAEWVMMKGLSVPSEAVEARFSWEACRFCARRTAGASLEPEGTISMLLSVD